MEGVDIYIYIWKYTYCSKIHEGKDYANEKYKQ